MSLIQLTSTYASSLMVGNIIGITNSNRKTDIRTISDTKKQKEENHA